ncbi:MAG: heme exporter protein CcmD [Rhodospirillales bacterium]|nr:heme exporter protein CcmD [Rhodospirillales bacterium]MDE2319355.1 heme exporter protein CcmD [Rhodospirillales bacterium]
MIQTINVWPFVNGAYGATVLFLLGAAWLTFMRYRRARARLAQAEQL